MSENVFLCWNKECKASKSGLCRNRCVRLSGFCWGTTKKAAKEKPTVPYEQIKPRVASSCMVNSPVITVDIKKTKEPYRDQILSLV